MCMRWGAYWVLYYKWCTFTSVRVFEYYENIEVLNIFTFDHFKSFSSFSVRCAWTSELSSLSCLNLWGTKIKLAGISVTKFWTCMMTNMHHRMISMIIFYLHYLTMLEPDWRVNIAYEILFKAETDWAGGPWLLLWKVIIVAIFLNDDNIQFCFWLEVKNNSHSALTKDQISNCLAIF